MKIMIEVKKFIKMLLVLAGFIPVAATAQESLSLSKALETALASNPSVRILKNNQEAAKNNNSIGNAGMLPSIDVNGSISRSSAATKQEYSNGNKVNSDGAVSDNLQAGIALEWTLFDGLKMFATRSRLQKEEQLSAVEVKAQLEKTAEAVIDAYFGAVKLMRQISVAEYSITIFEERLKIAETRYRSGAASKLEPLQIQVDRNARKSEVLKLKLEYEKSVAALNELMGVEGTKSYLFSDSISIDYHPVFADLQRTVPQTNADLALRTLQLEIGKSAVDEIKAIRFPTLSFNSGYNYAQTKNEVGFVLFNQNEGYQTGLRLNWNLFDGFRSRTRVSNSKLALNNLDLLLKETKIQVENELWIAFRNFEMQNEMYELELENIRYARENAEVALAAYRLGTISAIQMNEAQNAYEAAQSRLIESAYNTKVAETALMRLNGELIK